MRAVRACIGLVPLSAPAERRKSGGRDSPGEILVSRPRRMAKNSEQNRRRTAKRGNGEGGIYQRDSDGRWCASVSLANGKRRVIYGDTRQQVADKLNDLLVLKKQG